MKPRCSSKQQPDYLLQRSCRQLVTICNPNKHNLKFSDRFLFLTEGKARVVQSLPEFRQGSRTHAVQL
jgi:hypothetical protein